MARSAPPLHLRKLSPGDAEPPGRDQALASSLPVAATRPCCPDKDVQPCSQRHLPPEGLQGPSRTRGARGCCLVKGPRPQTGGSKPSPAAQGKAADSSTGVQGTLTCGGAVLTSVHPPPGPSGVAAASMLGPSLRPRTPPTQGIPRNQPDCSPGTPGINHQPEKTTSQWTAGRYFSNRPGRWSPPSVPKEKPQGAEAGAGLCGTFGDPTFALVAL